MAEDVIKPEPQMDLRVKRVGLLRERVATSFLLLRSAS